MDFMNRGAAQPQFRPSPAEEQQPPKHETHKAPVAKMAKNTPMWLKVVSIVLLVSGALLIAAVLAFSIFAGEKSEESYIQKDKYQAVFLNTSDGQVYFGKLSILNKNLYKLTNIYYVRVNQVQPSDSKQQPQQQISLAKLGSEIHGPQDMMIINRKDVIFWENLKDDGQVVKAIKDYLKNGEKSTDTTTNNTNDDKKTDDNTNDSTTTNP